MADYKKQDLRSPDTDPFANPIQAENQAKCNIDAKARIFLLGSEGNAVGDWNNNEEAQAVVLYFLFHNDPYENRIDINDLEKWCIVEPASLTDSVPEFTQVIANLANEPEAITIPPLSRLCNMMFDEGLEPLLSEESLWLVKLKMTGEVEGSRDTKRHGVGLFFCLRSSKTMGTNTATIRSIQKIFDSDDKFYFIVKRKDLDQVIEKWALPPIDLIPRTRIAEKLFPEHVNKPFLQKYDHPVPSALECYFRERCESVFRDVQEYNMGIGWGAMLDRQAEVQISGNGYAFKGEIQVHSVTRDDEYLAIIKLEASDPDAPECLQTGARFNIRWYIPDAPVLPSNVMMDLKHQTDLSPDCSVDKWTVTIISPALGALPLRNLGLRTWAVLC